MLLLLALTFAIPNPAFTPGLGDPTRPKAVLCAGANKNFPRAVPDSLKKRVFALYGIPWSEHSKYEVDHLLPHCAGGADDIRNLWPQPWPEAHLKDVEEVGVCHRICKGQMTQAEAWAYFSAWKGPSVVKAHAR